MIQPRSLIAIVLALAACTASRAPIPPATPSAPEISRTTESSARSDTVRRGYTAADVRFIQGMIAHHAQALAMTRLLPSRSSRRDMRLLAERIDVSQRDEIALMRSWLTKRGETVPNLDDHAAHQTAMPGMLTAAEMSQLASVSGPDFDRLFLELMIRHHEGALAMVRELFSSRGAGQETEIFTLASDVDADQRAEIARMAAMLGGFPGGARRP